MLIFKTLIHTILLPGTIIVVLPYLLLSSDLEILPFNLGALRFLGLLPIIFGLVVGSWCTSDFISYGRGTPNPLDPPKSLVARGPYRVVRNPMYVGVGSVLLGEVLLFGSTTLLVYAVVVLLGFHLFVTLYEEPTLKRRFGSSYEDYCRAVPRWIPRAR